MTRLMFSLIAAAFMVMAASLTYADCDASHAKAVSIDPDGHAVVSIMAPSHEIMKAEHDTVAFDANGNWTAYTFSDTADDYRWANEKMDESKNLYCFDATSKFCATAY